MKCDSCERRIKLLTESPNYFDGKNYCFDCYTNLKTKENLSSDKNSNFKSDRNSERLVILSDKNSDNTNIGKNSNWLFIAVGLLLFFIFFSLLLLFSTVETTSERSDTLTESQIRSCISGHTFSNRSSIMGIAIIEFYSSGRFRSLRIATDGSRRPGVSGHWSVASNNRIRRDFNPNPFGTTGDYIQLDSCNQFKIGETIYRKR